jgi:hypothetical protein
MILLATVFNDSTKITKINDSFLVMDEEAGKLVNDFSNLGGIVKNGSQQYHSGHHTGLQYEHNQ